MLTKYVLIFLLSVGFSVDSSDVDMDSRVTLKHGATTAESTLKRGNEPSLSWLVKEEKGSESRKKITCASSDCRNRSLDKKPIKKQNGERGGELKFPVIPNFKTAFKASYRNINNKDKATKRKIARNHAYKDRDLGKYRPVGPIKNQRGLVSEAGVGSQNDRLIKSETNGTYLGLNHQNNNANSKNKKRLHSSSAITNPGQVININSQYRENKNNREPEFLGQLIKFELDYEDSGRITGFFEFEYGSQYGVGYIYSNIGSKNTSGHKDETPNINNITTYPSISGNGGIIIDIQDVDYDETSEVETNVSAQNPVGKLPKIEYLGINSTMVRNAMRAGNYRAPTEDECNKLIEAIALAEINSVREAAMFIAQIAWESDGLKSKKEYLCEETDCSGMYTSGMDYPGKLYYGRGYIQLTHAMNYFLASDYLFKDNRLLEKPEIVELDDDVSWGVTYWYWKTIIHPIPDVSLNGHFGASTKAINGALECTGANVDRAKERFEIYKKILKVLEPNEEANEKGCYN
ncbi:Acidic endochitinase SP2 [Zancudomyces culisetae]|uniref:Acidic endochitinase SP2 n=1 Tax=Zancudomyces culisetae TaxID=1213189 RepID=A0A1R1PTT9_ZANCU|nr:Acidic endochitinase SP2 [Zancudomyces culisetae]|eukprot:OMH84380.1 Acidic endochitinase SP2 [Zancudomyces culisetae]